MARIKRGVTSHHKHKKLLESVKGYRGTKSKLVKVAREAALHAGQYAYVGRKQRKRTVKRMWNLHINEALKEMGQQYSTFTHKLKLANIQLNHKILNDLLLTNRPVFDKVVAEVK